MCDNDNIQKCCRICLDVGLDHVPVLESLTVNLHLKSCLGIIVSPTDELPKVVCVSCASQLSDFYNFILTARCSQDWLESSLQERTKKSTETKIIIQPLPDSEYNSDSLLEFLNNTANIEEYLNNLGKEDIPSIVNMFDKNHENSMDGVKASSAKLKHSSPKKKESSKQKSPGLDMEIDVLDSEIEVVKEILMKETGPKRLQSKAPFQTQSCNACKTKFESVQKLSQHFSICDLALRTCIHCDILFDSKQQMLQHSLIHDVVSPLNCYCGKQFSSTETLLNHHKVCLIDYGSLMRCVYRCKQCHQTFKERFELYRHAKAHILKTERKICDICGHFYIGKEALAKHRKEVHGKEEGSLHRCKICGHTSADRKEIFLHVQRHIAKQELERHLCESCGKSFATRATLTKHSLLHGHNGPQCKICNKTFDNPKTRDEHIAEHIELTMCEKCGQNVNRYKLESHCCV